MTRYSGGKKCSTRLPNMISPIRCPACILSRARRRHTIRRARYPATWIIPKTWPWASFVAKRGAEFSRGMLDHGDFAADRSSIDVDVERRHEDRHPMVKRARCAGKCYLSDVGDFAVSAGDHDVFR